MRVPKSRDSVKAAEQIYIYDDAGDAVIRLLKQRNDADQSVITLTTLTDHPLINSLLLNHHEIQIR